MHDPRLGRFLSIDPLAPKYAYNSPYAFSENRVVDAIELEGAESLLLLRIPIKTSPIILRNTTNKVSTQPRGFQVSEDCPAPGWSYNWRAGGWVEDLPLVQPAPPPLPKFQTQENLDILNKPETQTLLSEYQINEHKKNIAIEEKKKREQSTEIIYRSMKFDFIGPLPVPMLGDGSDKRSLAAKTTGAKPLDITPNENGIVSPLTGGMSVAPNPNVLPEHRRPPEFGGQGKDPVWQLKVSDLPPQLRFDSDTPTHGTIQPAYPMSLQEYQHALHSTQTMWKPTPVPPKSQ